MGGGHGEGGEEKVGGGGRGEVDMGREEARSVGTPPLLCCLEGSSAQLCTNRRTLQSFLHLQENTVLKFE